MDYTKKEHTLVKFRWETLKVYILNIFILRVGYVYINCVYVKWIHNFTFKFLNNFYLNVKWISVLHLPV